ncbi:MAG: VWA domain-containing protein [Phycisphaerales bacterium]
MDLRFEQPAWFWVMLLAVPTVWVGLRSFSGMTSLRRSGAVLVRVALLGLIAALLAGISIAKKTDALAVVALVDVSGSMDRFAGGPEAIARVRQYLEGATRHRGPEDLLGIVAFDGRAAAVARPTTGDPTSRDILPPGVQGTDIEQAIKLARAIIPPDAGGRIVLFSDGNQTRGDAFAAAEASGRAGGGARGLGVPIDVVPFVYDIKREMAIEAFDAPPTASEGSPLTLRVVISSTDESSGTLRLTDGSEQIANRKVVLHPGANVFRFEHSPGKSKVHKFAAYLQPDLEMSPDGSQQPIADTVPENNIATAFTITPGRGAVLLLDGVSQGDEKGDVGTLARTLRAAGADVTTLPPAGAPADLLSLQAYDLVILDNVSAADVPQGFAALLASYVSDLGGGLMMVGGPDSFAPGGWRGSSIEPILPVHLDVPDIVMSPQVATVFVLDNSGSMSRPVFGTGRSQQEIANDAAALAVRSLDPTDLVGVVVFNSDASLLVPLGPNKDTQRTCDKLRWISPGGGTDAVAGMQMAAEQMEKSAGKAKIKHIVLLTDGVSQGRELLTPLAKQLAGKGIKVSTIAVGDEADTGGLAQMATAGGGAFFHAQNIASLPRLLLKAVRIVRTPLLRDDPFQPRLTPGASPVVTGLDSVPLLGGMVITARRSDPTAQTPIVSDKGEPVLAHWPVGLGQVAAWTSDASTWARAWIAGPAFRTLWANVLHTIVRPPGAKGLHAEVSPVDGGLMLTLSGEDDTRRPLDGLVASASVFAPDGSSRNVTLPQVGPGRYQTRIDAADAGTYVGVLKASQGEKALTPLVAGVSVLQGAEYRSLRSDKDFLEKVAQLSGGRVLDLAHPEDAKLFDRSGVPPREVVTGAWRDLLPWLVGLLLLDVAGRRVAWDRWVSRRFRPELAQTAPVAAPALTLGALRTAPVMDQQAPAMAMGDDEAAALRQAARDRRRAAKLAPLVAAPESVIPATAAIKAPAEEGGLLAAKRRAAERLAKDAEENG